jgi:hypothetical protein
MFVGPTLYCVKSFRQMSLDDIETLPPISRGDLPKVLSNTPPGVIAIVDGYFHQQLSVSHLEIRSALSLGWQVWGLASMGAIRAYEMRNLGVLGYGYVYQCFFQTEDFRDDEVALLHEPGPLYRPLTEPLVHIRLFLSELVEKDILTAAEEARLLEVLMSLWYGDRTLRTLQKLLLAELAERAEIVNALLMDFDRFRVKSHDLANFMRERPWRQFSG